MTKPIVWTIAGSDSGGGAGIQADLLTFHDFKVFGCSVIAALTAQNSEVVNGIQETEPDMLSNQMNTLLVDLPPKVVKLGMLFSQPLMQRVADFLDGYQGLVVCDPVMISTSGDRLLQPEAKQFLIDHIIPRATLLTPNLGEAEALLGQEIVKSADMERAARDLSHMGAKHILIKGGHTIGQSAQDYWFDGQEGIWLTTDRWDTQNDHGSGCTLSAAITACLALDYSLADSLTVAKAYVSQGIRMGERMGDGPGPVGHLGWPTHAKDFPLISSSACWPRYEFARCDSRPLGLYPIVDRAAWLERLFPLGITTVQLRIKDLPASDVEAEIKRAVQLARKFHIRLFVNDYWELAIKHDAYGVHLGQQDLNTADLSALSKQGVCVGISTHTYSEVARALAINPSYIAFGPIYPTQSKKMIYSPRGLLLLKEMVEMLTHYPWVAVGGINRANLKDVVSTGVSGVAMISGIINAADPEGEIDKMMKYLSAEHTCVE